MAIKSFKYLCSPEEVEAFLKKSEYSWDCIELEMTGTDGKTWPAHHNVRTHKMFLLERKFLALGVDPRELDDYRQMAYEEGS
jgi:hypothetical protein